MAMKIKALIWLQKYKYYLSLFILALCIIVSTMAGISLAKKIGDKPIKEKPTAVNRNNIYEINDESSGLYFNMDKSFERIEQKELQAKNPYFVYGFKPKDVSDVACYVSQTKRIGPGYVSPEYLKEGTFNEIKKNSPDAYLENWTIFDLGSGNKGVKLDIKYKEGDKNMRQIEVVGATDKNATFAFCSAPESLYNELYKDKFNLFLNSLKIK